jgi:GNAT superfamily N-acetyltransferase
VIVRDAAPADALAVARVHVRTWQIAYRGLLPDGYLDALRAEDRAARYTFGDPDPATPRTLVAVDADAIIGFATIGLPSSDDVPGAGELLALYVDPDRWGTGAGRALIAAARHRLAARGHAFAVLWLLEGNARGARFYAADGWADDGARRTMPVWGIRVDERRLRRPLAQPE